MKYSLSVWSETLGSLEQFQESSNMDPRCGSWKADFFNSPDQLPKLCLNSGCPNTTECWFFYSKVPQGLSVQMQNILASV